MLCLRAEVLDDYNDLDQNTGRVSGSDGGGFVLPINFGSSIHKYLWRTSKMANRSVCTSGSSSISISDCEGKRSGEVNGGNMSLYKDQLEQDVKKLQKQLQEEIDFRLALAGAVTHSNSSVTGSPCQLPDKARELLDSISLLEITVSKLEKEYIALQYQISQERNERRIAEYHLRHSQSPASPIYDSPQAYLSQLTTRPCSKEEVDFKMEKRQSCSDIIEEPYKDRSVEKLWHHPNLLSEEMIMCMRDIFLFLADSSKHSFFGCTASPTSPQGHLSYSSLESSIGSPTKSPSIDAVHGSVCPRHSKFDPYRVFGKVDWTENIGIYSTALEVSWLSVGKKELEYASGALKRYRLLVEQLAEVDPSCLSCSEKMAFWINVYHALIMHAFLAYGVPRSDIKLFTLMQKAAYTIGGHSFNAIDIEYRILKMKPPAHRPQMALVLALQKFKITEEHKKFAIDQSEPLLSFALSCGMHSSSAVRIFRPDNVDELLKHSLKDYVQASVGVSNKSKLMVPKLLYCFAKGIVEDSQLPEWICQFLSPEQAAIVREGSSNHKRKLLSTRSFSVLPFDSRFRFLFIL